MPALLDKTPTTIDRNARISDSQNPCHALAKADAAGVEAGQPADPSKEGTGLVRNTAQAASHWREDPPAPSEGLSP